MSDSFYVSEWFFEGALFCVEIIINHKIKSIMPIKVFYIY